MSEDEVRFEWDRGTFEVASTDAIEGPAGESTGAADAVAEPDSAVAAAPFGLRTVVAVLVVAIALFAIATGSRLYRSRTITETRTVTPAAVGPAGVDAIGCPYGSNCSIAGFPVQEPSATLSRIFPDAVELSARASLGEADNSRTYFKTATVRTKAGIIISASAQCVPGGLAVTSRSTITPHRTPTDALLVLGEATPGCSVAVTAHAPTGVVLPVPTLEKLASSPELRAG